MISKTTTLIKFIFYYFINLSIVPSKDIRQKSLLLIRLDAIGDYVLFRNYIEILKNSEQYKEYKITLLGNSVWESISQELDSEFIHEFIWLDRNKFNKNFIYRYKKLKEIVTYGYEVVLNPVYSRDFLYGDTIVKLVNAKEKVGSFGDLSNIKTWQKKISDKYYTKLIPVKNEIMFEFDRNKEFFENFLHIKINIQKPIINLTPKKLNFELPNRYAIIFIGASNSFRKWSSKNFATIAKFLKEDYNYEIVLCGGPTDTEETKNFVKYYKDEYVDLVGRTSLMELLYIIYNGELMISNETSAPHFAVALEMNNVFVIYNGNHYGRFTPYPKKVTKNYHVIYHPEIERGLDNYKKLSNAYGFVSKLDINDISVESVIKKIDKVLNA